MLIYEYLQNKSLDHFLFDPTRGLLNSTYWTDPTRVSMEKKEKDLNRSKARHGTSKLMRMLTFRGFGERMTDHLKKFRVIKVNRNPMIDLKASCKRGPESGSGQGGESLVTTNVPLKLWRQSTQ